ncbi:hypothetical protein N7462_009617 [Penicillium macrosclerotiorum]|uniref:uncharacterized protein n=1 Tax=Penicillium macrosclerotiorum TaxID=303699 RepID=UPI00254729F0|nr:uncharacterized protein N7462_009617 [Penicillium macrosclerotiorum]KAJ5674178.1 hypothetical protein N7462_009617 [Penicillium macrosclerotiorum]
MKGTSIFQLKAWPKIHHPLPRTPRESQQLLNALTSSFRRQLDRAYPAPNTSTPSDRPPLNTDSSAHATDQHLHTILDNPLFRIIPPKARTVSQDHATPQATEEQMRRVQEPMVVFDEAVASGSASASFVTDCLKSQLLLARSSGEQGVNEALKATRAGSKVVNWFWASDGTSRQMLLQSRASTSSLTKFLAAEGLQNTVMEWLGMLRNADLGGSTGQMSEERARLAFSHLLHDFVDAEFRYGGGLCSAMKYYLRACHLHFSSHSASSDAKAAKSMLLGTGAHLTRIAMENKPASHQIPGYLYDEFSETMSLLSSPRSLLFASVALCHPSHPDPTPFIHFVDGLSPSKFQKWSDSRRDAFLRISCDALRTLIDRQKIRLATNLGHQIQQLLPEETAMASIEGSRSRSSPEDDYLLSRLDLNLT